MAARTVKIRQTEETRAKIKVGLLLKHLMDHAVGEIEMSATQIRAAEILLKKAMPDLTSVEHSGELNIGDVATLPDAQLAAIATRGRSSSDPAETPPNPSQLN
jgi:hypothetical protein